jgi:hypothetical protein
MGLPGGGPRVASVKLHLGVVRGLDITKGIDSNAIRYQTSSNERSDVWPRVVAPCPGSRRRTFSPTAQSRRLPGESHDWQEAVALALRLGPDHDADVRGTGWPEAVRLLAPYWPAVKGVSARLQRDGHVSGREVVRLARLNDPPD